MRTIQFAIVALASWTFTSLAASPTQFTSTTTAGNWSNLSSWSGSPTVYPGQPQIIRGVADNGFGLIRITLAFSPTPAWQDSDKAEISGVRGTTEANGYWTVTPINDTTFDLQNSIFTNAYDSGGTAVRGDIVTVRGPVNVDVPITIGNSSTNRYGYAVIIRNDGTNSFAGSLQVSEHLTIRGAIQILGGGSVNVAVAPGKGIEVDNSKQGTTNYSIRNGDNTRITFTFDGSPDSRCYLRSNSGGLPFFTYLTSSSIRIRAIHTDFIRIGSSAFGIGFGPNNDLDHCRFDTCGSYNVNSGFAGDTICRIRNTTFVNTVGRYPIALKATVANATGTRLVAGNVFDKAIAVDSCAGFVFDGNICLGGVPMTTGAHPTARWAEHKNSFFNPRFSVSGVIVAGGFKDCYVLGTGQTTNCRFITLPANFGDVDTNTPFIDGLIFDYPNATTSTYIGGPSRADGDTGDLIQRPGFNPPVPTTYTVARCITLPISSGHASDGYLLKGIFPGSLVTTTYLSNQFVRSFHNTLHSYDTIPGKRGGGHGALQLGEAGTPPVGLMPKCQSNIFWSAVASDCRAIYCPGNETVDTFTPSGVTNNGIWNINTVASGLGTASGTIYRGTTSGATPGSGDVTGDPNFADASRCFVKWVRVLRNDLGYGPDYIGARYSDEQTLAFGLGEMAKRNDPDFDPRFTVPALLKFVREGFSPRSPALQGKAHDGGDIGAVDVSYSGFGVVRSASDSEIGLSAVLTETRQSKPADGRDIPQVDKRRITLLRDAPRTGIAGNIGEIQSSAVNFKRLGLRSRTHAVGIAPTRRPTEPIWGLVSGLATINPTCDFLVEVDFIGNIMTPPLGGSVERLHCHADLGSGMPRSQGTSKGSITTANGDAIYFDLDWVADPLTLGVFGVGGRFTINRGIGRFAGVTGGGEFGASIDINTRGVVAEFNGQIMEGLRPE